MITRLSRVGFDNVIGYLEGGFETWVKSGKETDKVDRITPEEFEKRVKIGENTVIDIRKESEYEAEHIDEAFCKPLSLSLIHI